MKKALKITSMFLSVMMLAMIICSCGSSTKQSTDSSVSGTASATAAASTAPAEKEQLHTLKILGPDPGNKSIRWEDREEYPVYQKLKEMLAANNIELEVEMVPSEQYAVVIQTRMSGGVDLPDIANVSALDNTTVIGLAKQGIVQSLSGLISKYSNGNIDNMYSKVYESGYPLTKTNDGEVYWLTNLHKNTYQNSDPAPAGLTILLRQDWLSKLNLKAPTTLNEFTDALKQFRTKDANGNGQKDEILSIGVKTFDNSIAQWFGLGSDVTSVDVTNKKIVSPWYQDGIKDYFKYIQSLVKEGIIDKAIIGSDDLANQRIAENKVSGLNGYGTAGWLNAMVNGAEGVDYEPIMPVKAIDGVTPATIKEPSELVWDKYVITKNCKDIEGAIKFFDMIYSEDYATLCAWGIEGTDFTVENGYKIAIDNGGNEEKAKKRVGSGSPMWGGMLPRVQLMNAESSLKGLDSDIKKDYAVATYTYEPWFSMMKDNYLAMPTENETEETNSILTGITTYSQELCVKLCLGQASLDDWDSYTAEFEKLGLKKLISIEQARMDRFYKIMAK